MNGQSFESESNERQRAEDALRESEDHYRHSVELSPQVPWTADPQGHILDFNSRWLELTGLSREEALGQGWVNAPHPDDFPHMSRAWTHSVNSGEPYDIEHRIRTAAGEYRWMRSRAYPRRDAGGHILRWYGTTEDIEIRKQAEMARLESDVRYRAVMESMQQAYCIVEILHDAAGEAYDYHFLEANPAFERHTGFTGVVGRTALELVPDLEPEWVARYARVALSGVSEHFELEVRALGRILEVSAVRVEDASTRRVALLFTDVTERRRLVESLGQLAWEQSYSMQLAEVLRPLADPLEIQAAASETLGRLLNLSRVYYAEVDPSGEYVRVERSYTSGDTLALRGLFRMSDFGPSLIAALDQGRTQAVSDVNTDPELSAAEVRVYAGVQVRAHVAVPLVKNGRMVAALVCHQSVPRVWSAAEVRLMEQTAERTWSALESARLFKELQSREEAYRTLAESQKRFVNDAAHEMRAPLTAIQGNLELLRSYPDMPEQDRTEALLEAGEEAVRLSRLVNDMLALARGDAGEGLRQQPVALQRVLTSAFQGAHAMTQEHVLELGELPEVVVLGDPDRLKQLALILLENALRYTPAGGRVVLSLECDRTWATFRVADSGMGIAADDLERVFERFYRADKARVRVNAGTGLGLPIARWIAGAHGGRVWLESEAEVGTVAVVELPVYSPGSSDDEALEGE